MPGASVDTALAEGAWALDEIQGSELATPPGPPSFARSRRQVLAAERLLPASGRIAALGRLSELAMRLLGSANAQVSLLTEVQTVASGANLPTGTIGERTPLQESLCAVTAGADAPVIVRDARVDGRVARLPPVASGTVRSYLGVPLRSGNGEVVGALCVYDSAPHEWRDADVVVLEQLAVWAVAELELFALAREYEASRTRWDLAIDAAGIGGFDWDLRSGEVSCDDRMFELFGFERTERGEPIATFDLRIDPADLPGVLAARREAIDRVGTYESEYRVRLPSGKRRWIQARGRAMADETGRAARILGAALDTTELREGEARFARVLESMSAAFVSLDPQWRVLYVNAEAERLLGSSRDDLLGGVVWDLFPAAADTVFEVTFRRAAATGEPAVVEAYYPLPLDAWYEVRVWPSPDGVSLYFLDVTARRKAQELHDRAAVRAALLADVTSALTGTLDGQEAAGLLARAVVPALADWCVVSLVDDDEGAHQPHLRDVGWWHRDPGKHAATERYARQRLGSLTRNAFVHRVFETGQRVEITRSATAAVGAVLEPGAARELIEELGPESMVLLPLRAHDRTLGLLTLFRGPARPPLADGDLETAVEVAARAGLALDNARLYGRQRALAEGLQRALLTEPPQPDHGQIVVRYTPAAEVAQVGGDWYDAFVQPDGATVLVIGDVVGHDTAAAAAMGQLRSLLRGIAATTGAGPSAVLGRLDRAMELLRVETTATVVVLRVEQALDGYDREVTRVCWSNAGHPPPMVVTADGAVERLGGPDANPDLLLGVEPTTARAERVATLEPGATVVLYTDGLIERRHRSIEEGLSRLCDVLVATSGLTLEELCDELLARMLPDAPEDDVALVAVRLHRQDKPRPTDAGPERAPSGS